MTPLKKYTWEVTNITSIVAAIATLVLVTHLMGTPRLGAYPRQSPTAPPSVPATHPGHTSSPAQHSHPREVVVGPATISNRYTLLHMNRKPISPTTDELTISLHVESLATQPLVSPFESDMLAITTAEMAPISPKTKFRHPISSGNSLNQDIVFSIPTTLDLNHTRLQIHYYNYQKEIPLSVLATEQSTSHPPGTGYP